MASSSPAAAAVQGAIGGGGGGGGVGSSPPPRLSPAAQKPGHQVICQLSVVSALGSGAIGSKLEKALDEQLPEVTMKETSLTTQVTCLDTVITQNACAATRDQSKTNKARFASRFFRHNNCSLYGHRPFRSQAKVLRRSVAA
uniref:Uncharacterized protein n=1 Tax=Saccharum spontaneum TaxID=62335 RepID=A0A678THR8_SACSP|nr:hypothetical protein SS29K18_000005 [Saccharum spontaneum]